MKMKITRNLSNKLVELQEDIASYFCEENFPVSGELYWTVVESIASAKLMEMKAKDSL